MNELDTLKLKYQGLKERVGTLSARYEDEIAELRTQSTMLARAYEELIGVHKNCPKGQNEDKEETTEAIPA